MSDDSKSAAAAPNPLPIAPSSDSPEPKPAPKLVSPASITPAPPLEPKPAPEAKPAAHAKPAKSLKPESPTDPSALILDESIDIAAPVENVWRFFLNFVKWPTWCPVILAVKSLVPGTAFGLGWRFEMRLRCGPLKLRFEPIVLENSTPNLIRWLGSSAGVHGMHWWLFEKSDAGCRVTSYEEFTGPARLFTVFLRPWTRRMIRTWLESLKAAVEAQSSKDKKSPPLRPPD